MGQGVRTRVLSTVCVYEGLNNTYSLSTHKPPSAKCNGSGNKQ